MLREWIRGPVLDSRLYAAERNPHRNADLNFILSIYLNRVEPDSSGLYADGLGGITPILRWPDERWRDFRREFYIQVTGFFQERFWLVPPRGYTGLDWPDGRPTHRPNVKCGLTLWIHDRPEHARIALNCIYPVPGQALRSSMTPGSHFGELEADDTNYQESQPAPGEFQLQATVLHEVGHLLGLSHVARNNPAACPVDNAVGCYGTTAWQRGDLMGWGGRVEHWHSWPWRNRIPYHTGVRGWRAVMTRPEPQPLDTGQGLDAGIRELGGIRDAGV
jgi:hypothetical protein